MNNVDRNEIKSLEVVLSPALLPFFPLENKLVVVIDIFRASSAICAAFHHGVGKIIPVETVGEAQSFKRKGYIAAAERKGEVVPGFDFGNSPFAFMNPDLKDETIVLTTSNGTRAIKKALNAEQILIGSFLNISALSKYLLQQNKDVILLCAGWKNRFNLEDTLFAGAMVNKLEDSFNVQCDSAIAAQRLFRQAEDNMQAFLSGSSHSLRLSHLHIEKDIEYCLKRDEAPVIPVFSEGGLVPLEKVLSAS